MDDLNDENCAMADEAEGESPPVVVGIEFWDLMHE